MGLNFSIREKDHCLTAGNILAKNPRAGQKEELLKEYP